MRFAAPAAREAFVAQIIPQIEEQFAGGGDSSLDSSTMDDTSFLNGANPALAEPLLIGFNQSAVLIYWVGMFVVLIAFVLSLFFRTPPLRDRSALQEAADDEAMLATAAAEEVGAMVTPGSATGPVPTSAGARS